MTTDWAEIYAATYQDLVRFLHRKVWDAGRAEDLAQEAFVRALGLSPAQTPDRPRAWLFTVAGNLAKDEARSAIRRRRHLTLIGNEQSGEAPNPQRDLEETEKMEEVRQALGALSERDREILLLWDAGLSYAEIAEQSGLSQGAIGTTLARARRRLVDAYEATEARNVAHP
ncbi:MAG: sigma-70 family RNA polymerase sigma factor [Gemmatimonadota bacterium]